MDDDKNVVASQPNLEPGNPSRQREQAGDTTDDDKITVPSPPSLEPDDLSHQRGQVGDTTDDDKIPAARSQLSLDLDDPSRQCGQAGDMMDDEITVPSPPSLDPDDLSRQRGQAGDTTDDDDIPAAPGQLSLDLDDPSRQCGQADMMDVDKMTVPSPPSLDPDDLSRQCGQAGDTTDDEIPAAPSQLSLDLDDPSRQCGQAGDMMDDDKITVPSPPSLDPDDLSRQRGQAGDTTDDDEIPAAPGQLSLDLDDPSRQCGQAGDMMDDDKMTVHSQPSLDPDDQSCQCGQAADTMDDDEIPAVPSQLSLDPGDPDRQCGQAGDMTDNIPVPSPDPNDAHRQREDELLDLPQCETIARKAITVPDSLTLEELEELVRAICQKAAEDTKNAWPAANLCLCIIAKEAEQKFVDCLLRSCEEWFKLRAERLPRTTQRGSVWWKKQQEVTQSSAGTFVGLSWKWTAYVAFVAELLVAATGERHASSTTTPPFSITRERAYCLAILLCDCCQEILRFPAQEDIQEEMECLRSALTLAGRVADQLAPDRMNILLLWLRAARFDRELPRDARYTASELVNLRSLGWKEPEVTSATNL